MKSESDVLDDRDLDVHFSSGSRLRDPNLDLMGLISCISENLWGDNLREPRLNAKDAALCSTYSPYRGLVDVYTLLCMASAGLSR